MPFEAFTVTTHPNHQQPAIELRSMRVTTSPLLFTALAFAAFFAFRTEAANQGNWPQWRGPSGDGVVHQGNPPLEWSETSNVKWKVKIPGNGHATPIIWEDKLFVLTAVPGPKPPQADPPPAPAEPPATNAPAGQGRRGGRGQEKPTQEYAFTVICMDRKTGKVLWEKVARKEIPHQGIQQSNTYSSGSPVTDGERLYVWFNSFGLYCYDFEGKLIWQKDLGKKNVTFGEASSPALAGDVLIVVQDANDGSAIYGFDKKTGKELWRKERNERSGWTTPYVLTHDGKMQVVVNGSNAVRSYNPKTGEVIWECSGLGANPVPMVVADKDTVYAMSGHRDPAAMAIALGKTGNLTGTDAVKWRIDRGTPYVPSPLLYGDLLFFCQRTAGIVSCLDPETGKPFYAEQRLEGITGVYGSPIGVNNRIYLPGQNGTVVVLEKAKELKVLANNKLDDGFDTSPVVVGNELFLRGRDNLYCIAAK
jgi:outer membrane protein assembly factor BamB